MTFRRSKHVPLPAPQTTDAKRQGALSAVLDAKPLRKALGKLDNLQREIVETRASGAELQSEYDRLIADSDPNDQKAVRIATHLRTRLEMIPNYARRAEEAIGPALDALLDATRAFDSQLVASGHAEHAALRQAIAAKVEPALAPLAAEYRMDAPALAATVASSFAGLRHIPQSADMFQASPVADYMLSLEEARYFTRPAGNGSPVAAADLATFERILRERVAALLAAFAVWEGNGGSWVPADFDKQEPAFTVHRPATQPTYRFAVTITPRAGGTPDMAAAAIAPRAGHAPTPVGGSLGGMGKVARTFGGPSQLGGTIRGRTAAAPGSAPTAGAPAVDLQNFALPTAGNLPGAQGGGAADH